ncbi:MAG: dethiobiotin synthase [Fibrobacter sp.]|jgi:dethiobiotin synthetase|nr:dethiobiotin synthase [Fibrobacter sp.]
MTNTNGLFITGTGTNVGKTFTSGFIANMLSHLGKKVLYYKLIQCGAAESDGEEFPGGDTEILEKKFGHPHTYCSFQLKTPASPHYAFSVESKIFHPQEIHDKLLFSRKEYDFVIVEGAGGIRVPVSPSLEMSDLARQISFPTIVVTYPGLGTLNHSLLTFEHLKHKQIPVAGFMMNSGTETDMNSPLVQDTLQELSRRSSYRYLGAVPRFQNGKWNIERFEEHLLYQYFSRIL